MHSSRCRLVAAVAVALVFFPAMARPAAAFGPYSPGTTGIDVSYPSCDDQLPAAPAFAIIGVNGGRAFYQNPCLIKEFAWAQAASMAPSFFMNLNSPVGSAAFKARSGPKGNCAQTDDYCLAYNFGYNAARLAYADAGSQETVATMWWLDIETDNSWSDNTAANSQVIQGALDYLRSQQRTLGIYSTPKQWREIAGSFSPGLPVWTAGAPDGDTAPSYCDAGHAFGGGPVWLVQYVSGDYDTDFACGGPPVPGSASPGLLATAVNPTTIQLTWTAPPGPVDTYFITNGVATIATLKPPTASYTVTGLTASSYHCYAIAVQSGAVFSQWSSYSCITTPAR